MQLPEGWWAGAAAPFRATGVPWGWLQPFQCPSATPLSWDVPLSWSCAPAWVHQMQPI